MNITTLAQFHSFVDSAPRVVIADVETKGTLPGVEGLLGIALSWAIPTADGVNAFPSAYIVVNVWDDTNSTLIRIASLELLEAVRKFLRSRELVGHNVEYDRKWLDASLKFKSAWVYDTMIMYHLLDELQLPGGYGLKTAQVRLLNYSEKGDAEINKAIKERGGDPGPDKYLAPLEILGRYACLDAKSTAELYCKLLPKLTNFKGTDYRAFYRWIHSYNRLLAQCTARGVDVDIEKLEDGHERLKNKAAQLRSEIRDICRAEFTKLETKWTSEAASTYKTARGKIAFLEKAQKLVAFNFNSSHDKATLFYDVLGIPCTELTPTGQRKVDKATIATFDHPVATKFVEYAEVEKLNQMVESYRECVTPQAKVHFPYNITGTVSGRLGGFKPYALNMPFDSQEAMSPFLVPPGYEGIHSDLRSVEPCFIAALSKDPTLLKVHRDGLGDVYLDFALVAFPNNRELQAEYNPNVPLSPEVKAKFDDLRKVCKIVHLAVGYTGTAITVARTLNKAGFPTSDIQAAQLVERYWELFSNVYDLNKKCKQLIERKGHLINPFGRIITVHRSQRKDTMNRLIQSSAHDALIAWVRNIRSIASRELPGMEPLLPDCHDSTSHVAPAGNYTKAESIFARALADVSDSLDLGVRLTCETKPFQTLYGLKNRE